MCLKSWRDEIAPELAESHPDMVVMVAEKGKFDVAHVGALFTTMDEFLDESLVKVRRQVRAFPVTRVLWSMCLCWYEPLPGMVGVVW